MMRKFISFMEKWGNWKSVLAFFALQMFFNLLIMPAFSGSNAHDFPVLYIQFFYTPKKAYEIVSAYTPEMRYATALTRLTLDILYPLIYGLMLSLLLTITFRRAFPASAFADSAIILPWAGVLFDYLENICLAIIFLSYPQEYYLLAGFSAIFTSLKWILIGIAFLLALVGGGKLIFSQPKTA